VGTFLRHSVLVFVLQAFFHEVTPGLRGSGQPLASGWQVYRGFGQPL